MQESFSSIKIAAWLTITLWLTQPIIFRLVNIDFASIEIARNFRLIWLILIPLAIGSLIIKSWKKQKSSSKEIFRLSIGILLSTGMIVFLNFFSSFCEWQFSEPLYIHKFEKAEIRKRTLNCGAWDSDTNHQFVESYVIGKCLLKYSEIKINNIDKEKWIKKYNE